MRAMEVLPILKEKVAFLSGKVAFILLNYGVKLQSEVPTMVLTESLSVLRLRLRPLHLTFDLSLDTHVHSHTQTPIIWLAPATAVS